MAKFQGFPTDTLKFLNELKRNNQRDWFKERKDRYEKSFIEPALEYITAMMPHFEKISPFVAFIRSSIKLIAPMVPMPVAAPNRTRAYFRIWGT